MKKILVIGMQVDRNAFLDKLDENLHINGEKIEFIKRSPMAADLLKIEADLAVAIDLNKDNECLSTLKIPTTVYYSEFKEEPFKFLQDTLNYEQELARPILEEIFAIEPSTPRSPRSVHAFHQPVPAANSKKEEAWIEMKPMSNVRNT